MPKGLSPFILDQANPLLVDAEKLAARNSPLAAKRTTAE
jgi:hypothetical protein